MTRRVEAFVTAIGFPRNLDALHAMVRKNAEYPEHHGVFIDLDFVVSGQFDTLTWSVPSWAQPGDIAIFYCTQKSAESARSLRGAIETVEIEIDGGTESEAEDLRESYRRILDHAVEQTSLYAGTFIGIGRVASPPCDEGAGTHFRDRLFAEIEDVVSFRTPVSARRMGEVFQLRRAATITRMDGRAYTVLTRCAEGLPGWARTARIGLDAHPGLDWRSLVQSGEWRPRTEDEFREFLATPLLQEACGDVDGLAAECRTMRRGRWTGFVDNLVHIDGTWIAVEAKLRIPSEAAIAKQVRKYVGCTKAVGTLGPFKGSELQLSRSPTCWVIDSFGLYLVDRDGFVGCNLDTPLHLIGDLAEMSGSEIATLLRAPIPLPHL